MFAIFDDSPLQQVSKPIQSGISVILCCHNSEKRLRPTLEALAAQSIPAGVCTEILLVDNASTDNTGKTAEDIWAALTAPIPLTVVFEPKPGLIHARWTGIRESSYEILLFCDDDNLLEPGYLLGIYRNFSGRPKLAALGGMGIPIFEQSKPAWFEQFASAYATGSQHITSETGRILNLYGAGLSVRKSALLSLYKNGYRPLLTGRKGKALTGGEDTEMTYALVIAGHMLDYDNTLRFGHILPASRLEFGYLQKLLYASATDGPVRNLYHAYVTRKKPMSMMRHWPIHLLVAILRVPKYLIKPPKKGYRSLYLKWNMRYIASLIAFIPQYSSARMNIQRIPQPGNNQSEVHHKEKATHTVTA